MPPSDTWLNVALGVAAIATVFGIGLTAVFGLRYGRKASVSIEARAQPTPAGVMIVARPSITGVGVFKVKFKETRGVVVSAAPIRGDDEAITPVLEQAEESDSLFEKEFVEGGETLTTTTLLTLPTPTPGILGWVVWVVVQGRDRFIKFGRGWWWTDRTFVPLPEGLGS